MVTVGTEMPMIDTLGADEIIAKNGPIERAIEAVYEQIQAGTDNKIKLEEGLVEIVYDEI